MIPRMSRFATPPASRSVGSTRSRERRRGIAHRTQAQTWLRLAGHELVPAIYGPSGDVKWDEADPTYFLEAAKRGG
jgi:hypothetical protein